MTLIDLAIYCLTGNMSCDLNPMPIVNKNEAVVYICAPSYDAYTGKGDRIVRFERNGMKITAVLNCPTRAQIHDGT